MNKINYNNGLYYDKEIRVYKSEIRDYPIELDIAIRDLAGNPDCQIGHFGYNFWIRTNKGIKGGKYSTRRRLEQAVEQVLRKYGFEIKGWINK